MTDDIFESPYWVIDILPERVPKASPGQYFAVEEYFLSKPKLLRIKRKKLALLLKLNCYYDFAADGENNPSPEKLKRLLRGYAAITVGGALITSDPGDTYMTLYNPDDRMLELAGKLASCEGLFLWKGGDGSGDPE